MCLVETLLVKSCVHEKVIDTRAVFKMGGVGLAFKKVNSKLIKYLIIKESETEICEAN